MRAVANVIMDGTLYAIVPHDVPLQVQYSMTLLAPCVKIIVPHNVPLQVLYRMALLGACDKRRASTFSCRALGRAYLGGH